MVPIENTDFLARSFLFQRLKWPVPMSRWRTAKEIRNLLNDPETRPSTTVALLDYLQQCNTESEVCDILTIVFLTSPDSRPGVAELTSRIIWPSILADIILERTYGPGCSIGGWHETHSGQAPVFFEGGNYFEEHKTAHVPPILMNHLRKLEQASGYPLLQHWAYEWKTLCDRLDTRYTRYPHYFDDVLDSRSGIMGQYWQRMREVYVSAYLRTIAYAVSDLGMPQKVAEDHCLDIVNGIAGLFDVDPSARPEWLADIPERFCDPEADMTALIQELVQAARVEGMRVVSLNVPVAASVQKYARFSLSSHLVTSDYEFPDDTSLYEIYSFLLIADTFELKGALAEMTVEEASFEGKSGSEVAVCNTLLPMPFGNWHGDYFQTGLTIPAPYVACDAELCCTSGSIDLVGPGEELVSQTCIWNDDWVPPRPKEGSTRCGVVTMIDETVLEKAQKRLGRKLAWFARLQVWDREMDYGDFYKSQRTAFVLD